MWPPASIFVLNKFIFFTISCFQSINIIVILLILSFNRIDLLID